MSWTPARHRFRHRRRHRPVGREPLRRQYASAGQQEITGGADGKLFRRRHGGARQLRLRHVLQLSGKGRRRAASARRRPLAGGRAADARPIISTSSRFWSGKQPRHSRSAITTLYARRSRSSAPSRTAYERNMNVPSGGAALKKVYDRFVNRQRQRRARRPWPKSDATCTPSNRPNRALPAAPSRTLPTRSRCGRWISNCRMNGSKIRKPFTAQAL